MVECSFKNKVVLGSSPVAVTKVKEIAKEQREEILEQGKKKAKKILTKNCKHFMYSEFQCHLKYEAPPLYGM